MGVRNELFAAGDVYIDFPQEDVMFHFEHATGKIFRKFYWRPAEDQVDRSSSLFAESLLYGEAVGPERYIACGRSQQPAAS